MSEFLNEKQTEALLETQTRTLTKPNGEQAVVTGFMVMWESYDLIIEANMFSASKLAELADSWDRRENVGFDTALRNLVGYIHEQVKKM